MSVQHEHHCQQISASSKVGVLNAAYACTPAQQAGAERGDNRTKLSQVMEQSEPPRHTSVCTRFSTPTIRNVKMDLTPSWILSCVRTSVSGCMCCETTVSQTVGGRRPQTAHTETHRLQSTIHQSNHPYPPPHPPPN